MAALTQSRNTPRFVFPSVDGVLGFRTTAATTYFQGGIVAIESTTGRLVPGATATTLIAVGIKGKDDQTSVAADEDIEAESGVFKLANSAGDAIPATQEGQDCFIEDDQTVAATDGAASRSRAGKVVKVDTDGVWVQIALGL
jgi:hypothetical protein